MTVAEDDDLAERWYALEVTDVARRLDVELSRGLTAEDVRLRTDEYGPNALAETPRRPRILVFLDQFRSLLAYVLIGAALLAAVVGDVKDPIVISVVLMVNALIGFVQVNRAEHSMEALKRMLVAQSRVRRDGHVVEIDARGLVPGDVVLLEPGDRVPPMDGSSSRQAWRWTSRCSPASRHPWTRSRSDSTTRRWRSRST